MEKEKSDEEEDNPRWTRARITSPYLKSEDEEQDDTLTLLEIEEYEQTPSLISNQSLVQLILIVI